MKRKIIAALLIICFMICAVIIGEYIRADIYNDQLVKENVDKEYIGLTRMEPKYTKKETPKEEIKKPTEPTEIKEEIQNEEKRELPSLKIDHASLTQRNEDYRFWIEIPNTKINYPVVKGQDNQIYLHKDFDGNYLYAGTLFIDAYSEKGINQDNLIIYGHNMKSGSMFGTLKRFKEKEYLKKHQYINFYSPEKIKQFIIFSVREGSNDINSYDYILSDFSKKEYIENALKRSIRKNEGVLNLNDLENRQIITLVACTGNSSNRLLVSGIEIF